MPTRELIDVPAVEVISRAAVMLMSAAAEQLGLGADDPEHPDHRDLGEARILITALAGLIKASTPDLGPHAAEGTSPTSELHAQADYREHLARVLTKRAVMAAAGIS